MPQNIEPNSRNLFERNSNKESKTWENISGQNPIFDPRGKGSIHKLSSAIAAAGRRKVCAVIGVGTCG
jgi:hypothetical protein